MSYESPIETTINFAPQRFPKWDEIQNVKVVATHRNLDLISSPSLDSFDSINVGGVN